MCLVFLRYFEMYLFLSLIKSFQATYLCISSLVDMASTTTNITGIKKTFSQLNTNGSKHTFNKANFQWLKVNIQPTKFQ